MYCTYTRAELLRAFRSWSWSYERLEGLEKGRPCWPPVQSGAVKGASQTRACCRFFNLAFAPPPPKSDKSLARQARHRLSNPSKSAQSAATSLAQPSTARPGPATTHQRPSLAAHYHRAVSIPSLNCRLLDDNASRSDCDFLAGCVNPHEARESERLDPTSGNFKRQVPSKPGAPQIHNPIKTSHVSTPPRLGRIRFPI